VPKLRRLDFSANLRMSCSARTPSLLAQRAELGPAAAGRQLVMQGTWFIMARPTMRSQDDSPAEGV